MLKQKFILDYGFKFGIRFSTSVTGIIVARLAGPEVVGIITYATAYVSSFSFITGIFGSAHIKLVSEGQNEEDCNKTYFILILFSILIFFITVISFFFIQRYYFNYKYDNPQIPTVIIITLFAFIIGLIFQINETFYNARIEQVKSNLPSFLKNILYNFLRILVVIMGYKAVELALANIASNILILPLCIYYIRMLNFGKLRKELIKKYLKYSLPILSSEVILIIMNYSDKLILEYFSSLKEVGYYSVAYSIGSIFILLGNTAGTLFFPLFSSYISQNNIELIRTKIIIFERFIFVFIFPIIIVLAIYSYPIMVFLLGSKYIPSISLLSILVISSFFVIWSMPYGNVLAGLGLFWLISLINFVKLIIFLFVIIICILPEILNLGAMALAITALVTNLIVFLIYYYFAYKKIGINLLKEQISYILFWLFIGPLGNFFYVKYLIKFPIIIQLTLFIPFTIVLIYSLYLLFKLVTKSDVEILKQLLNLNSFFSYIKTEIKDYSNN